MVVCDDEEDNPSGYPKVVQGYPQDLKDEPAKIGEDVEDDGGERHRLSHNLPPLLDVVFSQRHEDRNGPERSRMAKSRRKASAKRARSNVRKADRSTILLFFPQTPPPKE